MPEQHAQPKNAPSTIDKTKEIVKQLAQDAKEAAQRKGLFIMATANDVLAETINETIPAMLFDKLWYEGEFCILYAYTNVGKSILAVQIAESIASGNPIANFELEATAQKVLYFDFELSKRQFTGRYAEKVERHYQNPYQFSNNLYWIKAAKWFDLPEGMNKKEFILHSIELAIKESEARVVVIDNMTALANNLSDKPIAQEFLDHIGTLQTRYELSVLILGHTNKGGKGKEIELDHLSGAMDIGNLIDSAFSIGYSNISSDHRYIKQMKIREDAAAFGANNVISCQIVKESNFLGFKYCGLDTESNLLLKPGAGAFDDLRIKARMMKEEGATIDEIMTATGLSKGAVSQYTSDITKRKGRNRSGAKDENETDQPQPF